jgi:hypothetical protein
MDENIYALERVPTSALVPRPRCMLSCGGYLDFAVRDERNSPMIHNRAPLARLLLLEGESYEEISL